MQNVALRILNPQDCHRIKLSKAGYLRIGGHGLPCHHALVGEHAVGVGQVKQRDLTAAQGQAQPIIVGGQRVDTHAVGGVQNIVDSHPTQHRHGGDIVRAGQGTA